MNIIAKINILAFCAIISTSVLANGGVQLDRTRVLMLDGKTKANYGVINNHKTPVLASSIITDIDGKASTKLTVSPPIFQIKPGKSHQGAIMVLESLPQDRETAFWLVVKTVGVSTGKNSEQSTLQMAIGQRIKVFYRPKGINEDTVIAADKLKWSLTNKGVKVENASKLVMSIADIKLGDKVFEVSDMVLPMSSKEWAINLPKNGSLTFSYMDEYGNQVRHPLKFN